jgi:hypothetical protein
VTSHVRELGRHLGVSPSSAQRSFDDFPPGWQWDHDSRLLQAERPLILAGSPQPPSSLGVRTSSMANVWPRQARILTLAFARPVGAALSISTATRGNNRATSADGAHRPRGAPRPANPRGR